MSDLAITQRCLDDDLAALPLEVATRVITAFEERRGLDPQSGETMSRVGGPLHKLHADLSGGRSVRAVTWYDQARDMCWLLAAGSARPALEAAIASPGSEVPVTTSPPPEAYFRVDGDVLWVRVTIFDRGRRVLTPKQVAAIEAAVFGKDSALVDYPPESGIWHSVLMMGPVPSLDSWPPPRVVQGAA